VSQIEAVAFDMGRVLVGLGSLVELLDQPDLTDDVFWPQWLTSPAVRAFETGRIDPHAFATALVAEVGLSITPDEFLRRLAVWPQGLLPGAREMVASVPVTTALLSNTNSLHWFHQPDAAELWSLCDRSYVSFELGMVKPDREVFDHIAADLGVAPERILFLDDSEPNVTGARAAGWRAERVVGVDESRAALAAHGVLA
jgi:putative hydrolase of the HAD superfamily